MRKNFLLLLMVMFSVATAYAQRVVDKLDRGLLAIKTYTGVYVNWRIQAEEYYDVTYNLYRNGTKIAENLSVSNFNDASGTVSSTYQVAPVVRGVEQAKSAVATVWEKDYMEITPKHDASLTSVYMPNDVCCADIDGDGVVELLLKSTNVSEMNASYPKGGYNGEYSLLEVMKLDGTVLWWVNCGPNMGDFQNNEQNIVGYDWDLNGKAEVVMRLNEGATVHFADGTTYTIGADGKNGTSWTNYRAATGGGANWFTPFGKEFLYYCDGETGKPYQCIDFPLKRLESGETDLKAAWGDGYGHRASKFFYGAPYLDGKKPSMFLGRGIYTRHKFIAYDVDPNTHELTVRWRWNNNQAGSPWYGQGYHNYGISDVDWDGRDEIVFGSMVIDDNGKGLSTTGLGHGDAQHHGDLNPYIHGQEGFFCNEDEPSNNYRDLTTAKIYYRMAGGTDDGRAIAGNFTNDYPGSMGFSAHDEPISLVSNSYQSKLTKTGVGMNFRIYWDGDLLSETLNGGDNTPGYIYKYGNATHIKELEGSRTNNSTKATPCFQGDIFGDWREEVIMRTDDNKIRIYSTTSSTKWRNYSLWYDHQYRNAVVWQPCGYNQPPHPSYFLGELEGITMAPPALTMTGRTEIANGGTISATEGTVITCETGDMTVNVTDGATPYIYIDNAPTWVQGSAPSEAVLKEYPITTTTYTHTLKGGAFAGDMRLVKQGDGVLVLPNVEQKYSGATDVWAGTLQFDGKLSASRLWLNRFAVLETDGGTFAKGIEADYASIIRPGGKDAKASTLTTDSLILNFGAICELDIFSEGLAADQLNANVLKIEKRMWPNGGGPEYSTPVFRINSVKAAGEETVADGKYFIGNVTTIDGNLSNITIEGFSKQKATLVHEGGKLYLEVTSFEAEPVTWKGDKSSNWNLDEEENFVSNVSGEAAKFLSGADVTFNDNATSFNVNIVGKVAPESITFDNTKAYTLSGDSIVGEAPLFKTGTGKVTINNVNRIGNTTIGGGTLVASSFANNIGVSVGSLGTIDKTIKLVDGGILSVSASTTSGQKIYVGAGNGEVTVPTGVTLTQDATISLSDGKMLTKSGGGTLTMVNTLSTPLTVKSGTFNYTKDIAYTRQVTLTDYGIIQGTGFVSTPVKVEEGANAKWILTDTYYKAYSGKLTGSGTVTVVPTNTVSRVRITGNWSSFTGTVKYTDTKITMPFDNSYGMPNATLDVAANCYVSNVAKSFTIGKVTNGIFEHPVANFQNSGSVSGSNTWKFGNSSEELGDFTFSGKIYDAGGTNKANFEKVGTCKMTVATSWENSGSVRVTAGTLLLTNGKTLGKGALIIGADGTLAGLSGITTTLAKKNPVTNSSVTINGTLLCGSSETATSGMWNFGAKPVAFNNGSILKIGIAKCATASAAGCSTIIGADEAGSSLIMRDGATVKVTLSPNYDPSATVTTEKADSFRVFSNFEKVSIGEVKFDLPELPAHYYWDTEKFATSGHLYIRYSEYSGVRGVQPDEEVLVTVLESNGVKAAQYTSVFSQVKAKFSKLSLPKGIYVLSIKSSNGGGSITIRK